LFGEEWGLSELQCQTMCERLQKCVAFEYAAFGRRSDKSVCELHEEFIRHVLPVPGFTCRVKPIRAIQRTFLDAGHFSVDGNMTPPAPSIPAPCGNLQCSDAVLGTAVGRKGYTCGERIRYLRSARGYDEFQACKQIAVDEYPSTGMCGNCAPIPPGPPLPRAPLFPKFYQAQMLFNSPPAHRSSARNSALTLPSSDSSTTLTSVVGSVLLPPPLPHFLSAAPIWLLVWSDEFDYEGPPDPEKWSFDLGCHGWGNTELQCYTERPENIWVSNGTLCIRARLEDYNGLRYTSARLVSRSKGDWTYGKIELRIKFPIARGVWAAAWMLPTDRVFGEWPRSGEIDIVEAVGFDSARAHATVHTEKYNHQKGTQVGQSLAIDLAKWHTYTVLWSAEQIRVGIDNQYFFSFGHEAGWEAWPFDHRFHLLLNIAVGGSWGGQFGVDEGAFAENGQIMQVDWVRVFNMT